MKLKLNIFIRSVIISFAITITILVLLYDHPLQTNRACASKEPFLKGVTHRILDYQIDHHFRRGYFLENISSLDQYKPEWNIFTSSRPWKMFTKNHGDYATVNVMYVDKKDQNSLKSYSGVIVYEPSREDIPYREFICSGITDGEIYELEPKSSVNGNLDFDCPPRTMEDC